jgi:hypothetical protein
LAEPTQYTFALAEVAEALVKAQNIHEGKWMVAFEYTVNIGLMGVSPTDARPGAMLFANNIQLMRVQDGAPEKLVVDAAKVNPPKVKAKT